MFDLAKLDTQSRSEKGVAMQVRHPTTGLPIRDSENNPVTITLLGRNSDTFKGLQRAMTARRVALQARNVTMTEAENKAERLEVLTAMTLDWSLTHMGEEKFPFSPENVKRLWSDPRWEWLAGQAYMFILEEGNFLAL